MWYDPEMRNEFTAIVEDGGDGFLWAWSPEVPAANGQGLTDDEALDDLKSSIEFVLEYKRDKARERIPLGARESVLAVG